MNHLWRGKVLTIPGSVLNYEGAVTGGAHFMSAPPPKNPGCPIYGMVMPQAWTCGDAQNH